MVKRDKNAHQSNHYKATHNSGHKASKKSGGKSGKGNKSINKFLGIGKPGPHLLAHKRHQEAKAKKAKKTQHHQSKGKDKGKGDHQHASGGSASGNPKMNPQQQNSPKANNKKRKRNRKGQGARPGQEPIAPQHHHHIPDPAAHVGTYVDDEYERDLQYQYDDNLWKRESTPTGNSSHLNSYPDQRGNPRPSLSLSSNSNSTAVSRPSIMDERSQDLNKMLDRFRNQRQDYQDLLNLYLDEHQQNDLTPMQTEALHSTSEVHTTTAVRNVGSEKYESRDAFKQSTDFIAFGHDDGKSNRQPAKAPSPQSAPVALSSAQPTFPGVARPSVRPAFPAAGPSPASFPAPSAASPHGQKRKRHVVDSIEMMDSSGSPAECPWMRRPYSKLPSVPTMLTRELEDFITFLNPTPEEHNVRALVFERIKRAIKDLWNTADVKVFGSFETQLYLPSSDMDVVVLLGREINKYKDLQNLRNHLRRSGVGENITCIAKARVPIVKFQETYSHISVDVSFNQVSGIEGAEVVKNYMTKTPGLRSLTMLIKQFLMANELNEVYLGGIGSYATVIMVLSFLQRHPAVQAGLINPDKNLGVLLIEFFELYGLHFNYQDVGIDVAGTGKYFPVTNRENNGHRHIRLVTLDPINADNNVTKGSIKVLEIRKLFAQAYERLTRNSREQHRDIFVDNERAGRGEISLLRGVLSIPERVMSQRYLLEKVYIQGHLQALLKRY